MDQDYAQPSKNWEMNSTTHCRWKKGRDWKRFWGGIVIIGSVLLRFVRFGCANSVGIGKSGLVKTWQGGC